MNDPLCVSNSALRRCKSVCLSHPRLVTCGLKVLRLSEAKLMDWLNDTFTQICEAAHRISDHRKMCQLKTILASSGGASFYPADSTASSAPTSRDSDSTTVKNLAFQVIADKLPYRLLEKLFSSLGLASLPADNKEMSKAENHSIPTEDCMTSVTSGKAVRAKSAVQTKRMKVAKGTKSNMSFFYKTYPFYNDALDSPALEIPCRRS
ncbi:hypothetical protein TcWFU_007838 [Taenia crassiceps]|uniref:Uncharacterized protein n=1 Tax=Taenia crassiceps TaxID=6207 RepID=A0ABR4Q248_9CEST